MAKETYDMLCLQTCYDQFFPLLITNAIPGTDGFEGCTGCVAAGCKVAENTGGPLLLLTLLLLTGALVDKVLPVA